MGFEDNPDDERQITEEEYNESHKMKLKPCPFCGEKEIEVQQVGTNRVGCTVNCSMCGCVFHSNEIGYGHFWNQRPTPEITKCNKCDEFGNVKKIVVRCKNGFEYDSIEYYVCDICNGTKIKEGGKWKQE